MTKTLDPGIGPSFPFTVEHNWEHDVMDTIKGYDVVIPRQLRPNKTVQFSYLALTKKQLDYILSFFHDIKGPAGEFLYRGTDPVHSPEDAAPTLSQKVLAGAPASDRTYYVKFTWYDPTTGNETLPSPVGTFTVQSGKVLVVDAPIFPSGVTAFRIYASTTQGTEWAQGYDTDRQWVEPVSGLVTATTLAPSVNNLKPNLKYRLVSGIQQQKIRANRWRVSFNAVEIFT